MFSKRDSDLRMLIVKSRTSEPYLSQSGPASSANDGISTSMSESPVANPYSRAPDSSARGLTNNISKSFHSSARSNTRACAAASVQKSLWISFSEALIASIPQSRDRATSSLTLRDPFGSWTRVPAAISFLDNSLNTSLINPIV
jgi:hypothetical protein